MKQRKMSKNKRVKIAKTILTQLGLYREKNARNIY
jgi:hypothetical protein